MEWKAGGPAARGAVGTLSRDREGEPRDGLFDRSHKRSCGGLRGVPPARTPRASPSAAHKARPNGDQMATKNPPGSRRAGSLCSEATYFSFTSL